MSDEKVIQALETALQMEAEGKKFYLEAAASGGTPVLMKFFKRLAADEDQHAKKALEIFEAVKAKGWPPKETVFRHDSSLKSVLDEAFEEMDADPVKPSTTETDAFKTAMALEDKSYTFYKARLEEAASPGEKSFYKALTGEERLHYLALLDSLEYLSNPQGWFSRKERWGLDG